MLSLNNWSSHWIHIKIERLGLRRSRSRGFRVRLDIGIREIFACGIWKHRKFFFWRPESWALGSEIQLKESGIPLTIEIQNPTFTEKDCKCYWYPESTAWNPESKTVLDFLIWGDRYSFAIHHIGHTFCDFQSGTIFVFSLHYTIMKFLTRTRISGVACMGTKCRFAIM